MWTKNAILDSDLQVIFFRLVSVDKSEFCFICEQGYLEKFQEWQKAKVAIVKTLTVVN